MYFIWLLFLASVCCQAAHVVVNCTWPCADSSQACVVSSTSIECRPQRNSQWVLQQPNLSPVFVGEIARWHTPCVTSPNPTLHYLPADTARISPNQSVIAWPPADTRHPLDAHLSDCQDSTFCNLDSGICVDRLDEDATCDSTNQCADPLLCIQNRCTNVSLDGNEGAPPSNNGPNVHIAIIIVVVVVAVLAAASIAGIVYYRRKVRMLRKGGHDGGGGDGGMLSVIPLQRHAQPPPSSLPQQPQLHHQQHPASSIARHTSSASSASSSSASPAAPPAPAVILDPTPTMQQQQLHYQLQRQHGNNDMSIPPPPYSP